MDFIRSHSGKMNLWPVEHFFEHFCHHFWVGATANPLGASANPPKSDDKYAQKSVQLVRGSSLWSEFLQNPYFRMSLNFHRKNDKSNENNICSSQRHVGNCMRESVDNFLYTTWNILLKFWPLYATLLSWVRNFLDGSRCCSLIQCAIVH